MSRIRLLIQSKLDADTLHYLQEPEKYTDSETMYNLRVEDSLTKHQLTFCLWGNVVKDPRYMYQCEGEGGICPLSPLPPTIMKHCRIDLL